MKIASFLQVLDQIFHVFRKFFENVKKKFFTFFWIPFQVFPISEVEALLSSGTTLPDMWVCALLNSSVSNELWGKNTKFCRAIRNCQAENPASWYRYFVSICLPLTLAIPIFRNTGPTHFFSKNQVELYVTAFYRGRFRRFQSWTSVVFSS